MHRNVFGEYFLRMVPFEIIEGPYKMTFLSFAILLEPNEYNMVDLDRVWKSKATICEKNVLLKRRGVCFF